MKGTIEQGRKEEKENSEEKIRSAELKGYKDGYGKAKQKFKDAIEKIDIEEEFKNYEGKRTDYIKIGYNMAIIKIKGLLRVENDT